MSQKLEKEVEQKLNQEQQQALNARVNQVMSTVWQNNRVISESTFHKVMCQTALHLVDELLPGSSIITSNNPNPTDKTKIKHALKLELANAVKHFENEINITAGQQMRLKQELQSYGLLQEQTKGEKQNATN